jgi:hypothetical protein
MTMAGIVQRKSTPTLHLVFKLISITNCSIRISWPQLIFVSKIQSGASGERNKSQQPTNGCRRG